MFLSEQSLNSMNGGDKMQRYLGFDSLDLRDQSFPFPDMRGATRVPGSVVDEDASVPSYPSHILCYRQPTRSIDWLGDFKTCFVSPLSVSRLHGVPFAEMGAKRQPEVSQGPDKRWPRSLDRPTRAVSPSCLLRRVIPKIFSRYAQHVVL